MPKIKTLDMQFLDEVFGMQSGYAQTLASDYEDLILPRTTGHVLFAIERLNFNALLVFQFTSELSRRPHS